MSDDKNACFPHAKILQPKGIIFLVVCLFWSAAAGAQTKAPPSFADYGKWETLSRMGSLAPDGSWMAYAVSRSNGKNELRILRIADGTEKVVAFGSRPVFSADSKWAAFSIGFSEDEREKLRADKKPVQNKLGLIDLATGEMTTFDAVQSFAFSSDGAFLSMHKYRPEPASGRSRPSPGGNDSTEDRPGTILIVRNLGTGLDTPFGNVSEASWQDSENSHLLAMTVSTEGKSGNGVYLFDPEKSVLRVLDSSSTIYTGLAWRKDSADLALFKAATSEDKEGPTQIILSWRDLEKTEKTHTYDPRTDPAFPEGKRIVSFRPLRWSDDGTVLFMGIFRWEEKILPPKKEKREPGKKPEDKPSSVHVWHWTDVTVMPWQRIHASQDRTRNMLSALHLDTDRFVPLGKDPISETVTPIQGTKLTYIADWSKYAMERSIGRGAADLYIQDIRTGVRTKVIDRINDRYVRAGASGKYLLFMHDAHFWTVDLSTLKIKNITEHAPVSFINWESDSTSKIYPDTLQKPPFGVAGWTEGDKEVLLYDKYDLWKVASDGSRIQRLTSGVAEEVRHRLVRLDQTGRGMRFMRGGFPGEREKPIDLSKQVFLSLYGEWTKKHGYGILEPGGRFRSFVWLDKDVSSLTKAKEAEVYGYIVEDYDDSPDIFICSGTLDEAKQVTETNPFQKDYAWGHSELIEYRTDMGRKLQGALFYPAGYKEGEQYPMIVYNYEILSRNVHSYTAPSDRSYYNISVFTSHGYLVLEPDIVFRPRQPGRSVVECITAGVNKVIGMGIVDPKRIGIIGHSMGGFNTTFAATHTEGIFAAAVAGAPITDLVSYYGDHHWGSGIAETDHIETGQERMVVPLYDDLQAYIDNSAVFNVHNMTVPLLLEAGDSDGIVAWYQSIELYNIARRAGKNVVMLAYGGEDHGLRKKENQKDYLRRILAWFGHYLKNEPAEPWITDGQSFLAREAEIKKMKGERASSLRTP